MSAHHEKASFIDRWWPLGLISLFVIWILIMATCNPTH
jgi:hypothetical protein